MFQQQPQQQQPAGSPKCFGNSAAKALSITQVVCGGIAIVLGVVIIVLGTGSSNTGYPIWMGALFLSTGIVGIFAAVHKTTCMIIPFMLLSILSAVLTSVMLGFAAAAVDYDQWRWCWEIQSFCDNTRSALLIVLALLEAGLSITTAIMTCFAVCPCCKAGGSDNCCSCDNQSYQPPAVAYQVGADGRLVQMPGQYAIQGGQPIAMTPFPASQPQHVTALPAGAMAQQPLLVTQTSVNMAAAQGNVGVGQGPKPQGNVVFVPVQGVAPAPRQHQVAQPMSTGGHGNIQYVIAAGTPIPHAAGQQQQPQSVPQVQFQQPSQAVPYPHPAQLQPQQQPNVPQGQVSAPPTGPSPPPSYQSAESDPRSGIAANQAMPTEEDDAPLIED
ncbi:uncharacterized protein [Branchiostoma lanceolatum]|uniref:uncharacterized protein isoform X2 n=1 Tax=Branchiostoma lanceolatum TaxID=7740 RepID=UPI003455BFD3